MRCNFNPGLYQNGAPDMKIVIYCQHVLGIGHFFRTLEICRALHQHQVVLVSGGPSAPAPLPPHVRRLQLPELAMDRAFQNLHAGAGLSVEETRENRRALLEQVIRHERPDLFMIELYPLGRKAFRTELNPILEAIKAGRLPPCRVVCSVRDILVEKEDQVRHETRAVDTLNRWFDALLVHADPAIIRLDATFNRMADIRIPVAYTGFVAPPVPPAQDGRTWKRNKGIAPDQALVVVSAGGGAVGYPLLDAVTQAVRYLPEDLPIWVQVFTGPFMGDRETEQLRRRGDHRLHIDRFATDFPAWLQAADLSLSMAGYNTCMTILATGVRALVHPFAQNREQGLRARLLADRGLLGVLTLEDLKPSELADRLVHHLQSPRSGGAAPIDIDGAANTARWIADTLACTGETP
jgi:predicted glycosyltransferase